MSAIALRSGRYRIENGALVFERPFVDPADKVHELSAARVPLTVCESSSLPLARKFMNFREAS